MILLNLQIGIYVFKGEEMPIRIPRIISDELFEEVQNVMKKINKPQVDKKLLVSIY